ncbi:hypothetical protein HQP42_19235 [Rhodococcus fascians]|nr:hypothetical protein VF34_00693 [Rhodococcus sp. PML026]MBY3794526.1 hypothetical protein [Rhodococcus fascians]MBY3827286.1 hypothetical protein [Rhodococcus fascians]MBY3838050.1 hypothetical protein [Rhodococcus fascians]MBY3867322.1 hypothetical protein [Rhodococcus fascians]
MDKLTIPPRSYLLPLPLLKPRSKLHICYGTPYPEALRDMYSGYGTGDFWSVRGKMRAGDLVLSLVATSPRMIIGLDEVEIDFDPNTSSCMQCVGAVAVVFENGILADAVATRCGRESIPESGHLAGRKARELLSAVDTEYQYGRPWFTPDRWREIQ